MTDSAVAMGDLPNLFDIVESRGVASLASRGWGLSVASDDSSDRIAPGDQVTAICSDDVNDGGVPPGPSVCADDNTAGTAGVVRMQFSACSDDESPSDVRLKADIEQVGTTVYGLPLYHFRYKTGEERFQGVMAQDVLEVMPDAVSVASNGFYRVNYAKLGIAMTRV